MQNTEKASFTALVNLFLFQSVWFLSVLGAANGNGWVGAVGLGVFFVLHYLFAHTAAADFRLALLAVIAGGAVETLMVQGGLVTYAASLPSAQLAPLWLLSLWAAFALTLNGCLAWLHGRYWLAAVLGAIGAPLSYFGGVKLGAATTDSLASMLTVVGIVYAIATPLLFYAARRLAAPESQQA